MTGAAEEDDLMAAVERVLLAETADLRELALIAKADPRTFYIGTSLDGVDLRGQDLRGMLLPNLDRARVRMDEVTRLGDSKDALDLAEEDASSDEVPSAYILVGSHRLWKLIEAHGHQTPGGRFYGPNSAAGFVDDCARFSGAKLVLTERMVDNGWPWEELDAPKDLLVLVYDRRLNRPSQDEVREQVSYWDAPQILVPTLREDRPSVAGGVVARFPTVIRDAVAYLAADWDRAYSFARDAQFSIFLRAAPTRTSPDPWLQLYSWAVLLGVQGEPGLRMGLPRDRPRYDSPDFGDLLFRHLEWQGGRLPEFAKFTAAALIEHGQRKFRVATGYGVAVERILDSQGWRVDKQEESLPTPLARVRLSSRAGSIDLNLAGADRVSRREHFTVQDLAGVQMDTAHIVATESADSATVVSRLVRDGELCVSVRDLADFEVRDGASVWDLIATLAMRVGRSGDFDQRTQFLVILVMRALREIPGSTEANFLEPLFQQQDFFDVARLRVLGGGYDNGQRVLVLALQEIGRTTNHELMKFQLRFGPGGPTFA